MSKVEENLDRYQQDINFLMDLINRHGFNQLIDLIDFLNFEQQLDSEQEQTFEDKLSGWASVRRHAIEAQRTAEAQIKFIASNAGVPFEEALALADKLAENNVYPL